MSGWREVCRWDEPETPAFKVVDKPLEVDWQATAGYWEQRYEETRRDLEALAARFNSRPLEERITVTEGQVSVRPYVRAKPRRSKLAAIEPDHPTVQAAPGEGQSGASGEDTGLVQIVGTCEIHGPPSVVGEVCYPDAIPAQPEERSE